MAEKKIVGKIDSAAALEAMLPSIRAAQEEFSHFTQEQVDKICEAAAMAADKMRIPLAKMAHEEHKAGIVVGKITKNNYAAEHIWNHMRNVKTCDIIEENKSFGTKRVASPIGIGWWRYPDHQPHLHLYLQDPDLLEDQKRHHHQPASQGKELHR